MKKHLIAFLPILIIISMFNVQVLFGDRDDDANKYYLDAYNMYKLGKLDQSLEMLRKVTETNPDHAEAHFGMGSIYFRQNMFDDAVKEFTKVTKIKPEYVEAYQRLWLAYKKLGMNDRAEEELLKYKKLIEERMQSMVGGSPQVAKPVSPPPEGGERTEKPKQEESKPLEPRVETPPQVETRPPVSTTIPETSVTESRPSETETKKEKPIVVKPSAPIQEEYKPPVVEPPPKPPVIETIPLKPKPVEPPPTLPSEMKSTTKPDTEYKSPYIKVDKNDTTYQNLFKPFKKMGSGLFRSPLKVKKGTDAWKGSYIGRLTKGFIYYIVVVQIWLCIVASLCIYFFKIKRE